MVRVDAWNYSMGGFLDSNMTHTNNLKIKQQVYRIINVNGANVFFFFFSICAWMD
jgi:hypothetical protein